MEIKSLDWCPDQQSYNSHSQAGLTYSVQFFTAIRILAFRVQSLSVTCPVSSYLIKTQFQQLENAGR